MQLAKVDQTGTSLSVDTFESLQQMAQMMASSGMFDDAKEVGKACVKIIAGKDMGFSPFQAMAGIHIVKGKPVIGANLIAAAIKQHPNYNYRIAKSTDKECTIELLSHITDKWDKHLYTFNWEDAEKAKLTNKDVWKQYPKNMLFARCISNVHRFGAPDIFGGVGAYVPGEISSESSQYDDDEAIDSTYEEVEEKPPAQTSLPAKNLPSTDHVDSEDLVAAIDCEVQRTGLEVSEARKMLHSLTGHKSRQMCDENDLRTFLSNLLSLETKTTA